MQEIETQGNAKVKDEILSKLREEMRPIYQVLYPFRVRGKVVVQWGILRIIEPTLRPLSFDHSLNPVVTLLPISPPRKSATFLLVDDNEQFFRWVIIN